MSISLIAGTYFLGVFLMSVWLARRGDDPLDVGLVGYVIGWPVWGVSMLVVAPFWLLAKLATKVVDR